MKRSTSLIAAGALVAAPLATVLVATPAHADVEKQGSCGAGTYEYQVDREGTGFEVSVDLDGLTTGARYNVVLRQDGKRVKKVSRVVDAEGDIEFDTYRSNTAGSDTFTFKAKPVGGGQGCSATIKIG